MAQRTCPCGSVAENHKGPPRCTPCRVEKVRLTQQRFRDKTRGSYQRGHDEPHCLWCGADNHPRPYEVLAPKRFCKTRCKVEFRNEQTRLSTIVTRKCGCGASPTNRTGIPYCDPCRDASKQRQKRAHNLRPYGIGIADYERMLAEQGGACAICRVTEPGRGRAVFAVDHDHDTDRVRGLLCLSCNVAIGLLRDSPAVLRAAALYLEEHNADVEQGPPGGREAGEEGHTEGRTQA